MNRLKINSFTQGLSNDPNIGGFKYCEGLEIRENSRAVKLSKGTNTTNLLTISNDIVKDYIFEDATKFLRIHSSGKITNLVHNNIDVGDYISDIDGNGYRLGSITTSGGKKGYIIGSTKFLSWDYDGNSNSLGIFDDTSIGIIDEPSFDNVGTWSVGAGWQISGGKAVHISGGDSLLQSVTASAGYYRFEIKCGSITTGTCSLYFESNNIKTFSSADSNKTIVIIVQATGGTNNFYFSPDISTFDGEFLYVNAQTYNAISQSYNFNESCPIKIIDNFIYIGNGNKLTEIDTTGGTFIINDVVSIDLDYIIKGITKVGDQVYIYSTKGQSSRQYLWDGASENITTSIDYNDKNIQNVVSFQNQDYVITKSTYSNKTGLRIADGYSLDKKFTNGENSNPLLERIYFNSPYTTAIETIGDRLIIPSNEGLMTYGQHTPGLPVSLCKEYLHLLGDISSINYTEGNNGRITFSGYGNVGGVTGVYETLIQTTQGYTIRTDLSGFLALSLASVEGFIISNEHNLEKIVIGKKTPTNTRINIYIYNPDSNIKYANIPYDYITIPTIGAIYSSGGNTYTIYDITDMGNYCILHCTYTGTATILNGTFTKTNGVGDNTFYTERIRNGWKLIGTTSDDNRKYTTIPTNSFENFNELDVGIELLTSNSNVTPELNNLIIYYTDNEDE